MIKEYWVRTNDYSMQKVEANNKQEAKYKAWRLVKQGMVSGWLTWREFNDRATVIEASSGRPAQAVEILD